MKPKMLIEGIEFDAIELIARLRNGIEEVFGQPPREDAKKMETLALIIFSEGISLGIQRERERIALLNAPTKGDA